MSRSTPSDPRREQQRELDRDGAIADLSQAVADREQYLGDLEQRRIDDATDHLDGEQGRGEATSTDQVQERLRLAAAQGRRDAHQQSLDEGQQARDEHLGTLDRQQDELEQPAPAPRHPTAEEVDAATAARFAQAEARAVAAEQRAEAALQRARAARARAQAHAERLHRHLDGQDDSAEA